MTDDWPRNAAHQATTPAVSQIDISAANTARAWNYMVGGKDNF